MPIYCFKLHDGRGGLEDEDGVSLRDDDRAIRYAHDVAHELMKSRELETRSWRLEVCRSGGDRVCEVPFASIDPTLDHLTHEQRMMVEKMSGRLLSLRDALQATYDTVQESRALLARSRGKPYLASRFGKRTIRDR